MKFLYYRHGFGRAGGPLVVEVSTLAEIANKMADSQDQAMLRLAWHIGAAIGICEDVNYRSMQ